MSFPRPTVRTKPNPPSSHALLHPQAPSCAASCLTSTAFNSHSVRRTSDFLQVAVLKAPPHLLRSTRAGFPGGASNTALGLLGSQRNFSCPGCALLVHMEHLDASRLEPTGDGLSLGRVARFEARAVQIKRSDKGLKRERCLPSSSLATSRASCLILCRRRGSCKPQCIRRSCRIGICGMRFGVPVGCMCDGRVSSDEAPCCHRLVTDTRSKYLL